MSFNDRLLVLLTTSVGALKSILHCFVCCYLHSGKIDQNLLFVKFNELIHRKGFLKKNLLKYEIITFAQPLVLLMNFYILVTFITIKLIKTLSLTKSRD